MTKQKRTKLVHEGRYLAEVDVEVLVNEDEWSPYLSVEDAYKLDDVRAALKRETRRQLLDMGVSSRSLRSPVDLPLQVISRRSDPLITISNES